MTKIYEDVVETASCPAATSAKAPRVWPAGDSEPCRSYRWWRRTKMGAAD